MTCRRLSEETIEGLDIVLSSAGSAVSAEWSPRFVEAGAVVIDNTSYWRMHEEVPLVIAGVNSDAAKVHRGIIANPNCTTMVMMMALAPIQRAAGLKRLIVSSYQAVSGTGQRAIEELRDQSQAMLAGEQSLQRRRSIRTRSPSTCSPRWRSSRMATTTRPRSAR